MRRDSHSLISSSGYPSDFLIYSISLPFSRESFELKSCTSASRRSKKRFTFALSVCGVATIAQLGHGVCDHGQSGTTLTDGSTDRDIANEATLCNKDTSAEVEETNAMMDTPPESTSCDT